MLLGVFRDSVMEPNIMDATQRDHGLRRNRGERIEGALSDDGGLSGGGPVKLF